MFVSIYSSYGTFCKPLPVGCFQKFRSYFKCCVTVMRFNLRDKVVLHVAIRAMRPRHCVGGGAAPVPKNQRQRGVGGQNIFFKDSRKNFVLFSKFCDDLFVIENCNKISTQQQWHRRRADKLSAAARRSTKGGGAHKLSAARL